MLKKIILGKDTDQLKTFFRALRSVNQKVFRVTEATEVTDEDRSRFQQVEKRALQVTNAKSRSVAKTILGDSDIHFFQYRLSSSQEVVDSINDTMLARFNFSVLEHSKILECKDSGPKIQRLCETMNLFDMDVENELKTLLRASLYEQWMVFRKQNENQDTQKYLRWLNALVSRVRFMFPPLHFNKAVNGSIILKFSTGDGFDIASLTSEFVRENVTDLLWKGSLETQMNIKNPVHVTVFIMSPSKNGNDEIHFYLDFDATDERTKEDCGHEVANQERLLEQLDLIEVTEWIMNQPDMEKTTTKMLEDKLSCSDMSRKEELLVLLHIIYEIKNGHELIERFCKEKCPEMYNNLFLRIEQETSEKNTSMVQKPLQYEKGRGLQRLYSFRIDINTDQKDIKMSQEIEGLQRATLDERPSKKLPKPEVFDIEMSQETEGLQRVTLDERPSKEMPNQEVSDSGVSPGYIHNLLPKIQKPNDDSLKPTVWKIDPVTYVIQVGILEDVWSDAIIIFGKDRYSLPRTFVEKVGPHIQREFKDKYPNGLCKMEVGVLSGFNLPAWKVFYCDCTFDHIRECLKMANKLKMKYILFLVQEEHFTRSSEFDFNIIHYCVLSASILTVYFHVDQDTLEWRKLRKTAEDILFARKGNVYSLPENPKSKVFNIGHDTVAMQVGKLEEIQSEAVVICEAATGQWPTQNLPSEILEKAGPMIQREFTEKFPAGLEYAEVAVLNGYNLPFRKILYGVLPRWPVAWVKQVMSVFLTECIQLASDEGIKSIGYLIPSVSYHIAELYTSVLYEMLIYDIVIKDDCPGANMLQKVFQDKWAGKRVFKEGHVTVVTGNCFLQDIVMRRRKATQTSARLSEGSQEKAIVPKSKALVIVSELEDFTDVLEEIDPSLKEEFRTKYPSVLLNDKVVILDGDNNPFNKIYWGNCTSEIEIIDIILECFQMAENDKMNSIILQIHPHQAIEAMNLRQELILGMRIFAIENPLCGIRRMYYDTRFFRKEIYEVTTSVKVFKERHVTVALNATYNKWQYIHMLRVTYDQGLEHKMNSVHVLCDVTDVYQPRAYLYEYLEEMKERDPVCRHFQQTQQQEIMHFRKGFRDNAIRVIIGTPKLDRQDMNTFFYKCIQEADGCGVSSVSFFVPTIVQSIKLFASTLISCVKRFAKETPSSSIKRIFIRIEWFHAKFQKLEQIFEEEWARTSGEENPDCLLQQIDEPQEEHGGKQGYQSEDIYLKKKLSISELPEKSKEGSKTVSQEDVDWLPHESSK